MILAAALMLGAPANVELRDYDLSCVLVDQKGERSRIDLRIGGQGTARRLAVSGPGGTPWADVTSTTVKPDYSEFDPISREYSEGFQVVAGGKVYGFQLNEYAGQDADQAIVRIGEHNAFERDYGLGACSGKHPARTPNLSAAPGTLAPLNDFYKVVPVNFDVAYTGRCSLVMADLSAALVDVQISPGARTGIVGRIVPVAGQGWPAAAAEGAGNFKAIQIAARDVPSRSYTFVTQTFAVNTSFGPTMVTVDHKGKDDLQTWVEVRRAPSPQGEIVGAGRCSAQQSSGI